MIPDSFKQDLLNRVDIVDVVSRYVQLKKGGANYLGLCPFHGEKTPSFTVSPAKQFYHCFGCGVHGNAIGFQMEYGGMGYIDAIKDLAASVGMQVPESRPRTPEEAAREERQTDLYAVMEQALAFYRAEPKYLNSPETPLFEKGREVYGLVQARDAIRTADRVLVVEGYMDVVALAQFEVGYAVATLGTATSPIHVTKLLKLADELVFSFDGDAAGRKAAWRALEVSLPLAPDNKRIRFLFLPDGDDPDTYIRKHSKQAFERLAGEAPLMSEFLLAELRSQTDLRSPEGRSQFLAAAKPHLQKITAQSLKLQLVKEVDRIAGVTQEEAEEALQVRTASPYGRPAPAKREFRPPSSAEWKLLSRVASYPRLAAEVDVDLLDGTLEESQLLVE